MDIAALQRLRDSGCAWTTDDLIYEAEVARLVAIPSGEMWVGWTVSDVAVWA